ARAQAATDPIPANYATERRHAPPAPDPCRLWRRRKARRAHYHAAPPPTRRARALPARTPAVARGGRARPGRPADGRRDLATARAPSRAARRANVASPNSAVPPAPAPGA